MSEHTPIYPPTSSDFAQERKRLAPRTAEAFKAFSQSVFVDGAVPAQTKQLIAVAVAHVTQCPIASSAIPRLRSNMEQRLSRLWKRFGSLPRCGQGPPTRIRCWPWR